MAARFDGLVGVNAIRSGALGGAVRAPRSLIGMGVALATGTLARYVASSAIALAADTATFLALLQGGMAPASAAAIGFMLGVAVHWVVSSRVLFVADVAAPGPERRRQRALFVAAALVGLALTTGIVGSAALLHINPRLAKLVAVACSFVTTSALRHLFVFRPSALA